MKKIFLFFIVVIGIFSVAYAVDDIDSDISGETEDSFEDSDSYYENFDIQMLLKI